MKDVRLMDNKGFTLVELMAVLAILTLISTIAVYVVSDTVEKAKKDAYNEQAALYERKTKEWVLLYGKKNNDSFHVTLQELVDVSLLDKEKLISSKDKSNFLSKGACVFVDYIEESKTYKYTFNETCVK